MARITKPKKHGERANRVSRPERGLMPLMGGDLPRPDRRDDSDLTPKTRAQANYIRAIQSNPLTFGIGPAGSGKSYVAACIAARMLENREIDKIIITRPVVEAGEELGFLPGEMEEKVAPYFAPIRIILEKRLGKGHVEALLKGGRIEFLPLAYMRGMTFERAFVLLDEAQNATPTQLKMFLTRIGEDTTVCVDGDLTQRDITGPSGLADAFRRLAGLRGVACVEFSKADVVRSGLVADIIGRYEHDEDADDRAQLDQFIRATTITVSTLDVGHAD